MPQQDPPCLPTGGVEEFQQAAAWFRPTRYGTAAPHLEGDRHGGRGHVLAVAVIHYPNIDTIMQDLLLRAADGADHVRGLPHQARTGLTPNRPGPSPRTSTTPF